MKQIFRKEEAVSPVIGTILMVAVTVVLAATVFLMVGHFGTGGSAPMAGSLATMTETSSSITLQLTYSIPANMTTLTDIHFALLSPAGATLATFTVGTGSNTLVVTSTNNASFSMKISNPDVNDKTAVESGAIIVLSGSNLSGDVLDLTYSSNSGSISLTLP